MTFDQVQIPCLELQQLKVISALGRGAKGVVFLVQTDSDELLALKTILIASLDQSRDDEYRRICFEQEVLTCFHHPLLPKLRGVLSTDKIIGYAIDYCPGRHLNSLRMTQTERMLSDDMIRFYAAELVLALDYLHGLGIVYRDLKPENVMIHENGHLMLVDFDLSTKLLLPKSSRVSRPVAKPKLVKKKSSFLTFYRCCNSGISPEDFTNSDDQVTQVVSSESDSSITKSNSFVGTEEYIAPEIIQGKGHDFAVDWWCLGVTLYEMLYSVTPFRGMNRKDTFDRILSKSPQLIGEPTALRDLIGKLLEKDPRKRINVEEIKGHGFFSGIDWDLILQVARPPFIPPATEHVGENIKVNNEIDVECFVQEIMQVGVENRGEKLKEIVGG